ncbi:hypothetical protein RsTz2092_04510 [Deferribacterales bacterium RsTz2092]
MKKFCVLVLLLSLASLSMAEDRKWNLSLGFGSQSSAELEYANGTSDTYGLGGFSLDAQLYFNKHLGVGIGFRTGGNKTTWLNGEEAVDVGLFSIKLLGKYEAATWLDFWGGIGFGLATLSYEWSPNIGTGEKESKSTIAPVIEIGANVYWKNFMCGPFIQLAIIDFGNVDAAVADVSATGAMLGFKLGAAF